MKEQAWIKWAGKFSGSHGHTLSEICEELDLDIEDLAQDPCVPLLHADTDTMTEVERIQEVLYEAYTNDALIEVYDVTDSGDCLIRLKSDPLLHADTTTPTHAEKIQEVLCEAYANDALVEVYDVSDSGVQFLGMAKAKDVDIFQTSEGQGYIIEVLIESGLQFRGKADNFQILPSGGILKIVPRLVIGEQTY